MKRNTEVYIQDILESIDKIQHYTISITEQDFCSNTQIQDAVLRRLEIIGEAVKNIPVDFRNEYPNIPWKKIAGMRDVLTHAYFGVNINRVWKVIKDDIPALKTALLAIIREIKNKNP